MIKFIKIGNNYRNINTVTRIEPKIIRVTTSGTFWSSEWYNKESGCYVYFSTKYPNTDRYHYEYDNRSAEEMAKVINEAMS